MGFNSGGDWVWSHYRGVGLTYNVKQGDNSGGDWVWSHFYGVGLMYNENGVTTLSSDWVWSHYRRADLTMEMAQDDEHELEHA
jgi:hypothetical protein